MLLTLKANFEPYGGDHLWQEELTLDVVTVTLRMKMFKRARDTSRRENNRESMTILLI